MRSALPSAVSQAEAVYGTASFTCLIFDPVENPPNWHNRDSERLPETASKLAERSLWVAVRPALEKPTQGLHGPHSGRLHLQVGTLVFTLVEGDLFALEGGGERFRVWRPMTGLLCRSALYIAADTSLRVVHPPGIVAALTDTHGVVVKVKLNERGDPRIIWHGIAQNGERHIVDRLAPAEIRLCDTVQRIFADLVLQRGQYRFAML